MQRKALDQPADRDLGERAAQEHRRGQAADRDQRNVVADALVDDLRQRHRDGVEHQAGAERDDDEQSENRRGEHRRQRDVGRLRARGRVAFLLLRNEPQIDRAGRDADHAGNEKGAAPGQRRRQRRRDPGRKRDAEIAADAVKGERAAALGGFLDDHRGADRMIDGGEYAERKQRKAEHVKRRRESRGDQRHAAADIEREHQVAAAPAVAEPAGRQREQAEGDEGRGREPDQARIGAAVDDLELLVQRADAITVNRIKGDGLSAEIHRTPREQAHTAAAEILGLSGEIRGQLMLQRHRPGLDIEIIQAFSLQGTLDGWLACRYRRVPKKWDRVAQTVTANWGQSCRNR